MMHNSSGVAGIGAALLVVLMVLGGASSSTVPLHAQGGPTSTLPPATPTPEGTPPPTFIPSAPQQPGVVELGATIEGELLIGRWDVYEFTAISGQDLTIRLRSGDFDAVLEVYAPTDYAVPFFTDDESGRGRNAALYGVSMPATGVYRVFVRSYKNEGSGRYLLTITEGAGSPPDTATTSNIAYGDIVVGTLASEEDTYAFTANDGDVISVLLSSTDFDTYLEVVDASGRILDDNDDNGRNRDSAITNLRLPSGGTYYIIVTAFTLFESGDYQLELLRVDPTTTPIDNTLTLNSTHRARLLPDTSARWTFEGTAGQRISLGAVPVNPADGLDLILELNFPGGGREINDDGGYERNPAFTDLLLPETGTYIVNLREFSATIGGDYYLSLYAGRRFFDLAAQPGVHLLPGEDGRVDVLQTASNPGNAYALYTVTVPTEQWLSVRVVTGNGGAGLPQDVLISPLDSTYSTIAEPQGGTLSIQNTGITTDFLLLLQYRGPGQQSYRMTLDLSTTPPPIVDLPILGTLELMTPLNADLPIGVRHARVFVAPTVGTYTITLTTADAEQNYDPYLYVLNELGEPIVEDDDSAGGLDPQLTLDLMAGQEIIVVAASFADATGGAYQLQITQE
jgi:hypothetical protein